VAQRKETAHHCLYNERLEFVDDGDRQEENTREKKSSLRTYDLPQKTLTVNAPGGTDYVGAPWIDRWYGMDIGNGGLSLRKTKTMIRVTKSFKFNETENEDIYFARGIYKLAAQDPSIKIPPVHVAAKFAYEAGKLPRVTSFGVHKTPLMEVDKEAIAKTCPEAMASVWRECKVETYEGATTLRGAVTKDEGEPNLRFLAADRTLNVLDFENDYNVAEQMPLRQ